MQNLVQRADFLIVELSTLMTVFSVILTIVGACYTVDCLQITIFWPLEWILGSLEENGLPLGICIS